MATNAKKQGKSATINPEAVSTCKPELGSKPQGKIENEEVKQPSQRRENKVDIGKALKMRLNNHLSYQEIADKFGCDKSYIYRALKEFEDLIKDPEALQAYHENKAGLLTGIEMTLAKQMVNEDLLKAASLNNVAYAFQQIHNAGRLERGASTQNISIAGRFMMLQDQAEEGKD